MKAKRKTKKTNGQKYMEALAVLEARITELEKNTPLFQSVAKLGLKRKDVLVLSTKLVVPESIQDKVTQQIARHVGQPVSILFLSEGATSQVLHAEPE
jgi:hypothetical protein